MTDIDALCARLTAKHHNGMHTIGGAGIYSDGRPGFSYGGEKIMVLTNPDGPAAADAIAALVARVVNLELELRGADDEIKHQAKRARQAEARAEAAEARVKELEATAATATAAGSSRPSSPE